MIHRINLTLIISSLHFADEDGRMESELLHLFVHLSRSKHKQTKRKKQNNNTSLHLCFSLYTRVFDNGIKVDYNLQNWF